MGQLLRIHKIIIVFSVIGLVLALCLHLYVSEPAGQKYKNLAGEVDDLHQQLRKLKAPADKAQQASLCDRVKRQQQEPQRLGKQVLELYASVYKPVVEQNNWSLDAFIRQSPKPTRDFYMKEFDRVIRESPFGDLTRGADCLGLNRDSDSPERYQQLLQLWCVDSLLKQAKHHQLDLVWETDERGDDQRIGGRSRPRGSGQESSSRLAPALRILPATELQAARGQTRRSEFLELRFRLGVTGTLPAVEGLVRSLSSQGTFFGISAFELMQLPPRPGTVKGGVLQLNVECVTYVPLERD